jgi:hypothetical protein
LWTLLSCAPFDDFVRHGKNFDRLLFEWHVVVTETQAADMPVGIRGLYERESVGQERI